MAEPTSTATTGIAVIGVLFTSQFAGEYAIIVMAALAGSLWPLSAIETTSRAHAALFVLRMVATAVVLTGLVAWQIEQRWGVPVIRSLAPVAFFIAAMGDSWRGITTALSARIKRHVSGGQK